VKVSAASKDQARLMTRIVKDPRLQEQFEKLRDVFNQTAEEK
jgi:hypothetical protein